MKTKLSLIFLILCSIGRLAYGQSDTYLLASTKISPFPDEAVVLKPSWVKQREALNTAYLLSLDPDRLLHNFRVNAGLPSTAKPLSGWEAPGVGLRGHFTGHYLSAVAMLAERDKDTAAMRRLSARRRPASATFAPSRANKRAVASPMPEVAPLIQATLFSSRPIRRNFAGKGASFHRVR